MSNLNILELVELLKTIRDEGAETVDWEINIGGCGVWVTDKEGFIHYYGFRFDELNPYEEGDCE